MKKYLQAALILGFLEFIILYFLLNRLLVLNLIGIFHNCLLLAVCSMVLYFLDQRYGLGSISRIAISLIICPIICLVYYSQANTFDEWYIPVTLFGLINGLLLPIVTK
jgi:hypothetical protein